MRAPDGEAIRRTGPNLGDATRNMLSSSLGIVDSGVSEALQKAGVAKRSHSHLEAHTVIEGWLRDLRAFGDRKGWYTT